VHRELEAADPCGGILADDMGLGKTMQAIGLMAANPMPTLIVVMVGTLPQWRDALIEFGGMRPIIVNSSFSGMLPTDADVVLTGYSTFNNGRSKTPSCLLNRKWGRIILDEGHTIRNPSTTVHKEISRLQATHRWILSGTPIQNSKKDIKALLGWIGANIDETDIQKSYDTYILRRTQQKVSDINPRLALPKLTTQVVKLPFTNPAEKKLYDDVERHFQEKVGSAGAQQHNTAIEGIMRCRQVCTSPILFYEGMARKTQKCAKRKRATADDDECTTSSKIEYLCNDISTYLGVPNTSGTPNKCLVFCNWTTEMRLIQSDLRKRDISALIFDGNLSRDNKATVLYNFKHSSIPVLILQIACGSTGLNLQSANRVYITSPQWNPCLELQAIGRAHRKGQDRPVTCMRLMMKDTIEERCIKIQETKLKLIADAMDDESMLERMSDNIQKTGLSKSDIAALFDANPEESFV
jgi:SNF2 family DNA or RNA helicase